MVRTPSMSGQISRVAKALLPLGGSGNSHSQIRIADREEIHSASCRHREEARLGHQPAALDLDP
jgi:hypothetical protein